MDRVREREQKMKKRRGRESHWRLKHTGDVIRFGSNDIMLLTRFGLLVPAQHKFHWSHMESGLVLNTTWCISAERHSSWGTITLLCQLLASYHFTIYIFKVVGYFYFCLHLWCWVLLAMVSISLNPNTPLARTTESYLSILCLGVGVPVVVGIEG